jgi:predicted metal-binding protein
MIEICHWSRGDADLSGTPDELQAIADAVHGLVGSDSECVTFDAETGFDPAPYDANVPTLRIQKAAGPGKVSLSSEELVIEGSPESLIKFTSYLNFPTDAQPSNHTRYEYWAGADWISPNSMPLIIGIRQRREGNEVDIGVEDETTPAHLEELVGTAISLGASDAKAITADDISIKDSLAHRCIEPRCDNYGLSPSCPPHVSGPSGFRELQETLRHAVVVRIVVPSSVLVSYERKEFGRFLHELVAAIEQEAAGMGYTDSRAFAGGSCKNIFCHEHLECRRLSEGECRHPQHARPSMSGFGIDVFALMKTCGWPADVNAGTAGADAEAMSWLAGLVMIG